MTMTALTCTLCAQHPVTDGVCPHCDRPCEKVPCRACRNGKGYDGIVPATFRGKKLDHPKP